MNEMRFLQFKCNPDDKETREIPYVLFEGCELDEEFVDDFLLDVFFKIEVVNDELIVSPTEKTKLYLEKHHSSSDEWCKDIKEYIQRGHDNHFCAPDEFCDDEWEWSPYDCILG